MCFKASRMFYFTSEEKNFLKLPQCFSVNISRNALFYIKNVSFRFVFIRVFPSLWLFGSSCVGTFHLTSLTCVFRAKHTSSRGRGCHDDGASGSMWKSEVKRRLFVCTEISKRIQKRFLQPDRFRLTRSQGHKNVREKKIFFRFIHEGN